jgi:YgiT-type zinc finger domain-containing protein
MKMTTCPFCKGGIEIRRVNHMHEWGNEVYLFENISEEVCSECGEVFWAPETLKAIDQHAMEKKGAGTLQDQV